MDHAHHHGMDHGMDAMAHQHSMNDSSHDHMAHALPTVASTAIPHDHSQHLTAGNTMEHMMSMAFHFGCNETILFSWWKIDSVAGLLGSMLAIFVMATLYEGLKYYREYLFWKTYNLLEYRPVAVNAKPEENQNAPTVQPSMLSWMHFYQTFLHIIQVTLSFLLMLIFMTYNVWLCVAVVLGAAVGYFLFCWKKSVIVDVTEHCH